MSTVGALTPSRARPALGEQRQFAGSRQVDQAQASSEPAVVRRPFCALDEASYHLDSVSEPLSAHLEVRLSGTDVDPLDVGVCANDDALRATRAELQSLAVPLVTSPPLRIRLARHREGDVVLTGTGTTVNDLLLAGLHLALDQWNAEVAGFADHYVAALGHVAAAARVAPTSQQRPLATGGGFR